MICWYHSLSCVCPGCLQVDRRAMYLVSGPEDGIEIRITSSPKFRAVNP